jgi:hypothetical protein
MPLDNIKIYVDSVFLIKCKKGLKGGLSTNPTHKVGFFIYIYPMKHLKKFNESSDNKIDHLRDVFENLEDDFGVDVEYTRVPFIYGGESYFVIVKSTNYLSIGLLDKLVDLVNMSVSYCDLDLGKWEIFASTFNGGMELIDYSSKTPSKTEIKPIGDLRDSKIGRYKYVNIYLLFREK